MESSAVRARSVTLATVRLQRPIGTGGKMSKSEQKLPPRKAQRGRTRVRQVSPKSATRDPAGPHEAAGVGGSERGLDPEGLAEERQC
eukprot:3091404-Pyramimonas_sp.AAC.2